MRRLKLQVQMTVDGFIGGPGGGMDWLTFSWDDGLKEYVRELMAPVDLMLMSHKMAGGFIPHWQGVASYPAAPDQEAGRFMVDTPKLLFSQSKQEKSWPNSRLLHDFNELLPVKAGSGGDIIVYGGAGLVSSLIAADLIDEYHLFVNPVALGKGLPIFAALPQQRRLRLTGSHAFDCGIVVLAYER